MRSITKNFLMLVVVLCMSAIQAMAGIGTVTVQLLASDGITGVPGATVKYYKGGEQTLGVTDANGVFSQLITDIAGTTTFYLLPANGGRRIWLSVDPATNPTLTAQMTAVTIDLKTCAGAPLTGEALYYRNGWTSLGNTPVTVDLLPFTGLGPGQGSYDFRMNYDGRTSQTLRQDISADATVDFTTTKVDFAFGGPIQYYNSGWQTFVGPKEMIGGTQNYSPFNVGRAEFRFGSPVVLQQYIDITGCSVGGALIRLVDENNAPLANFNGTYKSRCGGSWTYNNVPFTTDANGFALLNTGCTSNNWDGKITITVNQTSKEQVVATNSVYQLAKVNVNLKDCDDNPLDGGVVAQGGGTWVTHGTTDASGTVSFYAFPGNNVKVRMNYHYGSLTINSTAVVLPTTEIDYVTTTVNLAPGPVKVGSSGWPTIPMPYEMLPGTYNFRLNGNQINGVVISGCDFGKTLLRVKNELGGPVAGVTFVPACGGSWQPQVAGSTDANGYLFADMPGCMTKVKANVSGSGQELTKAQLIASNYTWTTEVLRMNFKDHAGNFITDGLGTIQSGGGWPTIGSFNASGYFEINSFPATTGFRATYNNTTEQKNFTIVAGPGVQEELFQTGQVIGACITQYAAGGWSTFTSGMELMPGTRTFRYPSQSGTVTAGAITYLACPTSAGYAGNPDSPVADFVVFPNPFSKQTTIRYTMKTDDAVTVSIFDARGLEVTKLYQGFRTAGDYAEVWEGATVPPGVYYLRILTSEGVTTHTMIKE